MFLEIGNLMGNVYGSQMRKLDRYASIRFNGLFSFLLTKELATTTQTMCMKYPVNHVGEVNSTRQAFCDVLDLVAQMLGFNFETSDSSIQQYIL